MTLVCLYYFNWIHSENTRQLSSCDPDAWHFRIYIWMLLCAWWYNTAPRSGLKHLKTKNFDILRRSHHSCNSRKCQRSALYVTGCKRFSYTGFYVANFNCDIYVYSSYICTVNVKSRHVLHVCTLAAVEYHPRTFSLFYPSGTQLWY